MGDGCLRIDTLLIFEMKNDDIVTESYKRVDYKTLIRGLNQIRVVFKAAPKSDANSSSLLLSNDFKCSDPSFYSRTN